MPQSGRFRRILSQSSILTTHKLALSVLVIFLAGSCLAQEPSPAPDAQASASNAPAIEKNDIVVPAGTRIALVLTHPIRSRSIHRGDDIYAQITAPVTVGDEAVIPPGAFVQGQVDKLEQKGGRGELHLQSLALTFPDGHVALIAGPVTLESADGYALKDPGNGRMISAFVLPAAGAGLGALIGHAASNSQGTTITNTLPPNCGVPTPGCTNGTTQSLTIPGNRLQSTAIGSVAGMAVGGLAAFVMLMRSHNFFLDVGSPVDMTLDRPLSLDRGQIAGAGAQPNTPRVQVVVPPPGARTTSCAPGDITCP
jgi:hypothetical protein